MDTRKLSKAFLLGLFLAGQSGVVGAQIKTASCHFSRTFTIDVDETFSPRSRNGFHENSAFMEFSGMLARRSKSGQPIFELIESYEYDTKREVLTLHLRENCGWSDGHPVTVQDVVLGIKAVFDARTTPAHLNAREVVKDGNKIFNGDLPIEDIGVRAVSEKSVEIDIDLAPSIAIQYLTHVAFSPIPSHVVGGMDDIDAWHNVAPLELSSGAYYSTSNDGHTFHFEQNPHYCAGLERDIPSLTLMFDVDKSDEVNLLLDGKVSILTRLAPREITTLLDRDDVLDAYQVIEADEEVLRFMVQSRNSGIAKNIRYAILGAIDYDLFKPDRALNVLRLADSLAYRYDGYDPEPYLVTTEPYDVRLEQSKKEMRASGYNETNRLKLTVLAPVFSSSYKFATNLQSMLGQIYIDTEVIGANRDEYRQFWAEPNSSNIDLAILGWGSSVSDPLYFLDIYRKFLVDDEPAKDRTDELSRLINDSRDDAERMRLLEEFEAVLKENGRIAPLYWQKSIWLLQKDFSFGEQFFFLGNNIVAPHCRSDD